VQIKLFRTNNTVLSLLQNYTVWEQKEPKVVFSTYPKDANSYNFCYYYRTMHLKRNKRLEKDLIVIALSVVVGIILLKTGLVKDILYRSAELEYIGIFIAGIMFTSIFTTVPATIILGELALVTSAPLLALVGGLGALIGDFLIFRVLRENITEDVESLFHLKNNRRWKHLFKSKIFRGFVTLIGGIVLASPLPDEMGLALMGFSKTSSGSFAAISFICNFSGIYIIALIAQALL